MSSGISKDIMLLIFEDLNKELKTLNITTTIDIYGGGAMVLGYDARQSTKDIDSIYRETYQLNNILSVISQKYNLRGNWFNNEISSIIGYLITNDMKVYRKYSNLTLRIPSDRQLLAMKLLSARAEPYRDFEDAEFIVSKLKLDTREKILKVFLDFFNKKLYGERQKIFLDYVCSDLGIKK